MLKVTVKQFQKIISQCNRGKKPINLNEYEIIPEFELTGNKIIDSCNDFVQKADGSIYYYGGHSYGDAYTFEAIVNKHYKTTGIFFDGYRAVLQDTENLCIYTYCEGDISVRKYSSVEALQHGVVDAKEFYENN
jgi:hypothetical protein